MAGKAGGITQHVGAYEISHGAANGQEKKITFIDTPGHEAFSGMREQGAALADLAILVVSAEDGVKPQTLEAKLTIEKNQLPYLVAISKIDKPTANPERTKKNLSENGIFLEGLGGSVPWIALSAQTGAGVPELLDLVLLLAEMAELKKDIARPARGVVLEAEVDPRHGISATVIIRDGTLRRGDYLVTNDQSFRIRQLKNFLGQNSVELAAASPAIVGGWKVLPAAGAIWQTFAERVAAERHLSEQLAKLEASAKTKLTAAVSPTTTDEERLIPIVIKADTVGTLEAVKKEILKINVPAGLRLQLTDAGVGAVTENDVKTGSISPETLIIGFNVTADRATKSLSEKYGLKLNEFNVIYHLNEWLTKELAARVPVKQVETVIGTAKIIKLFSQSKNKQIVGGLVMSGKLVAGRRVLIRRRETVIGEGELTELQQQQNVVKEVEKGKQFGALVESRTTLAPTDLLEVLEIVAK